MNKPLYKPLEEIKTIKIRKANEHNLKSVDLDIPRNEFVVITGLSGSGKSSLAFDTIFAEGQRRYIESLSTYARQFLGQSQKPDVESIEGLTPTIAISQRTGKATPRSTVATTTEIYDYLRLLFARVGTPHCPKCDRVISSQSPEQIVDKILEYPEDSKLQILSPVVRQQKGEHKDLINNLQKEGFHRLRVDGKITTIEEVPKLKKTFKHSIEVVVDRIKLKSDVKSRINDSVETALKLSEGLVLVLLENKKENLEQEELFSENFTCPEHGAVLEELSPRMFSFNSPFGACPVCSGLGTLMEPDPDLVVSDPKLSLENGALTAWKKCGSGMGTFYPRSVRYLARIFNISTKTKWEKIDPEIRSEILFGSEKFSKKFFEGVIPNLVSRFHQTDSEDQKARIHGFMTSKPCQECGGQRLKHSVLSVRVEEKNIHDLASLNIGDALDFFQNLELTGAKLKISEPIKKAILDRLYFLNDVGLSYLNMNRSTNSLSGGEAQRIRLASQVGAKLAGVTYVLDEPTIGLHQRDNLKLLSTLLKLRDIGNTVVVVEHDEDVIKAADFLVDMGPGAGEHGGRVLVQGKPELVKNSEASLTGKYLSRELEVFLPKKRRKLKKSESITIKKAEENNLKKIDVKFPLGGFICVTGVSGSGKSSLVNQCLLKGLQKKLGSTKIQAGKFKDIQGYEKIDKIIAIDQSPIGRTPRSNPVTYTGVFDAIRKVFSVTSEAKSRGYTPGRFSFNVKGGRCEICKGQGTKTIEMHFLPDIHVDCEVCKGSRFNRETLEVKYRGKTIADVLNMPVTEALDFFKNHTAIFPTMETLKEVGLGYIRLGQPATTLSGGEAQRVKLASELSKRSTGSTFYVLDEPTTGLHFHDINHLLGVLHKLVDKGNSIVVIEHNLDVVKNADYIIDIGPEGGDLGGKVVAEGTPEEIAKCKESYTGQFLKEILK